MWLERLEKAGEPWINTWLLHQTRDEFWKHASVCEDYSKVLSVDQKLLEMGGTFYTMLDRLHFLPHTSKVLLLSD